MSWITPNLTPMHYIGSQTISWTVDPQVSQLAYSIDDIPPAISEYIAYDTLTPPNPFLAVTQDGKGNVVYDGGFPKFYNRELADPLPTTFAGMNAACKYLHNALNFVANPAVTNNQVLVIGNREANESYSVKSTETNGFFTTFTHVADIAGYDLTFKTRSDWGGVIDARLSELENYALVILLGGGMSDGVGFEQITAGSVADIVTYRSSGGGLIFITDHGPAITDINDAIVTEGGFFDWLNRITVNFGAYFTGDFDRTPVNVGFLRQTYGDHPLYNGMLDSEDIHAQGSESQVVVTEIDTFSPATLPNTTLSTVGSHTLNFLAIFNDGSVATSRFTYTITDGEFLFAKLPNGNDISVANPLPTYRRFMTPALTITDNEIGTLQGDFLRNNVKVGEFSTGNGITTYTWVGGDVGGVPTEDGDLLTWRCRVPFDYRYDLTVVKSSVSVTSPYNLALCLKEMALIDLAGLSNHDTRATLTEYALTHYRPAGSTVERYSDLQAIIQELDNDNEHRLITLAIYANATAVLNATTGNDVIARINAANGDVYLSDSGSWVIDNSIQVSDFLPLPCTVQSLDGNLTYRVSATGSISPQ